jgi:hypothetical protein
MTKSLSYILFIAAIFICSCSGSKSKNQYPAIDVTGYIKGQIKTLDSVPYGLLKVTERYGQLPDSTYLNKATFIGHIMPFLLPSIEKSQLEEAYEETSFADASIGYVVITYQAKKEDEAVRQIVVYIRPDNNSIHQVYISGNLNPKNQQEKKQILWMHNRGCTIITGNDDDTTSTSTVTEKLIWQ